MAPATAQQSLGTFVRLRRLPNIQEEHGWQSMGADEAGWADVRRAHDLGEEPAAVFCRRLGVSESAYYARRKRLGWPVRPKIGSKPQPQSLALTPSQSGQTQKHAALHDDLAN